MPGSISNTFMTMVINSPLHFLLGPHFAVITVVGRKTGRTISIPVNVTFDEQAYTVISMRNRKWWRNLREKPLARLRVGGKTFEVEGKLTEAEKEVSESLQHYFEMNPKVARYFGVRLAPGGRAERADLMRAAAERVIIRLRPVK